MTYDYPAVFYADDKAIAFHFYDREDWFSFGETADEAIIAAEDVLNDALLELERTGKELPPSTPLSEVVVKPLQLVKMIHADTDSYARELEQMNDRAAVEQADNSIRELLNRRGMKIKELSDELQAPYRTVQDWALGKSKPPAWCLKLILDKFYGCVDDK